VASSGYTVCCLRLTTSYLGVGILALTTYYSLLTTTYYSLLTTDY
jgi:hypothetical protein